ncbi:hypothetical protein R2F25_38665 [Streptomyces sp. UP1A-1]|nr:hypothetical protein [Streptomyces sp. UP1A-1]
MPVTPWYQLTAAQKASIDADVTVFREAIRRAEDEQDIVTAYNAADTAPVQAAEPEPAAAPCDCPSCTFDAAFLKILEWGARRYEELQRTLGIPNSVPFAIGGLVEVPVSWRPDTGKDASRTGKTADGVPGEESLRALLGLPPKKAGTTAADEKTRTRAWFEGLAVEGELPTVDTPLVVSLDSPPLRCSPANCGGVFTFGTREQHVFDAVRRDYQDQRRRIFWPKV